MSKNKHFPTTVFIAGKITGDEHYWLKFAEAEDALREKGFEVVNPSRLPEWFPWETCIRITEIMISACDGICLLPDWVKSRGAKLEAGHAMAEGKAILRYDEIFPVVGDDREACSVATDANVAEIAEAAE